MRALILTAAVVLLAACKPAPTDTAAPVAATPAAATAPASPEAPAPEPGAAATPASAGTESAPAAPASDEGSAQVNQSIEEVLGDPAIYEPAIRAFQKAVAAHDAVAVARMADYPFNATIDGKPAKIKDAAAFAAAYDKIVTPAIAKVVSEQKYAELAVSGKGVMFGNGEAWINGICKDDECKAVDVRVVAIQPTEAAAH
jgi:ketosteroid isomerase-like protein